MLRLWLPIPWRPWQLGVPSLFRESISRGRHLPRDGLEGSNLILFSVSVRLRANHPQKAHVG